jgi:hypothetical protein
MSSWDVPWDALAEALSGIERPATRGRRGVATERTLAELAGQLALKFCSCERAVPRIAAALRLTPSSVCAYQGLAMEAQARKAMAAGHGIEAGASASASAAGDDDGDIDART